MGAGRGEAGARGWAGRGRGRGLCAVAKKIHPGGTSPHAASDATNLEKRDPVHTKLLRKANPKRSSFNLNDSLNEEREDNQPASQLVLYKEE